MPENSGFIEWSTISLSFYKLDSWSKTHIFAASTITQYWLNKTIIIFFSDNATVIYWMKETNSCFLRIASKAPMRIQHNLYTAFEWIWRSKLQNFIFCSRVLREKMKIKVSSEAKKSTFLTWQGMLQIKMCPTSAFFWKTG